MAIHNRNNYPIDEIRSLVLEGKTQEQIADLMSKRLGKPVGRVLIYKVCKKHGIPCKPRGPRPAEGHPEWRGGRIVDRNGYFQVYVPDHPEVQRVNRVRAEKANGKYYRKERYIQEHRLVMEKHLGRYLLPTEVVHHKNNDKQDNRIENLELFDSNAKHLAETLKGKCPKWTKDGLLRIRSGVLLHGNPKIREYGLEVLADLLLSIQQELKLDVPPSKIEIDHYLAQAGITLERACEKVRQQRQQQTPA